jgi:ATP-dependent DNA ligase
MTCQQRETLPITDFTLKENRFDGIYIGRLKGKVDHGFDDASAKDLQARPKPLIRRTQPYSKKIAHRGIWVEPSLHAEIEYRATRFSRASGRTYEGGRSCPENRCRNRYNVRSRSRHPASWFEFLAFALQDERST